ncbi:hypothetical protein [Paraglaciecola sp. L3A3]|uniref:hypothetical protein n=1 Tax=Paraglaciecola sp. L3A3 TaxID=2686358 RepID=UPI00131E2472|nr:hypothetical protein [Paraglaciecola sp. L3A3]
MQTQSAHLKTNKNRCAYTYCRGAIALLTIFSTAFLFGCENPDKDALQIAVKSESSSSGETLTKQVKSKAIDFAPTVSSERKGLWLGGAPALNKRVSMIDTYYQLKAGNSPDQVIMTLRFEGAKTKDARVSFKPIDGAKFLHAEQRAQWKLKPDIASQVTITLVLPKNTSYLTLNTFQNGKGASRAFLLNQLRKHK